MTPQRTAAQDAALRAFKLAVFDEADRYPDDLKVVAADQLTTPGLTPRDLFAEVRATGRTIVIVAPDGFEVRVVPRKRMGVAGQVGRLLGRRFAVDVEQHACDASHATGVVHARGSGVVRRVLAGHA